MFLFMVFGTGSAAAAPTLQAIAETSLGYTDNFRTTPDSAFVSGTPRTAGTFLMLSPSLVLAFESRRALQRLVYRYEYDLFLASTNSSGSSNRLGYNGFFELSPLVSLLVGSSASETDRYPAVAFSAPAASSVVGLPAGSGAFAQAEANEALSFDFRIGWRAWQTGNVVVEAPILGTVAPQTTAVGARAGAERSFLRDAVGVEGRAEYTVVNHSVLSDGSLAGVQEQLVAAGVALWRHDWGPNFTSSAEAGAARVQRFNTGRGLWSPTGAALLAFVDQAGDAQLSYAHDISTNALLGQSLLADEVRLRGALPLTPHAELLLAVTAGYQHGRLIDENATLAAHVNVLMGDVSLGWQTTPLVQLALRYQHIQQRSDALAPPLPLSFVQNSVLLGAILKFPPARDTPRPYRAPRRVDRSDEIREGVSPATVPQQSPVPSGPR